MKEKNIGDRKILLLVMLLGGAVLWVLAIDFLRWML